MSPGPVCRGGPWRLWEAPQFAPLGLVLAPRARVPAVTTRPPSPAASSVAGFPAKQTRRPGRVTRSGQPPPGRAGPAPQRGSGLGAVRQLQFQRALFPEDGLGLCRARAGGCKPVMPELVQPRNCRPQGPRFRSYKGEPGAQRQGAMGQSPGPRCPPNPLRPWAAAGRSPRGGPVWGGLFGLLSLRCRLCHSLERAGRPSSKHFNYVARSCVSCAAHGEVWVKGRVQPLTAARCGFRWDLRF